ncbi:hypothetical protein IFM89_016808 [Coptis chinensis]|uniref:PH domain-containing protein n=1 Tax=Coptis chinensis TaxID=261450 RepID=A0A835J0N0_9MAGN|nr:hypothetical protein IFM89_016808 [Coptis chinensis]
MLEDQVANLLQRYLGNYVKGLNKEALKISVWQGDVELTNMQLKPEALNALNLPVKVKAGFLGSVRLKVPWSRLGQEPVLVYLDRIFILAEPATHVEGCSEDALQEAKKSRVREMEIKLLESKQQLKSEMSSVHVTHFVQSIDECKNTSWLGSLINTIIGNLKLSITNIHIRYEDLESNPGHPFAAGLTLDKLSAMTVDENGRETFVTGGALERIQKSVELERLALYLDSDIRPWSICKSWEDLLPSEWSEVFEVGSKESNASTVVKPHSYVLQPVTGNAKYSKLRVDESKSLGQPLQKAAVYLDDVTLCLSKDGYRDVLRMADNFAAFNQRLKYAHFRPNVPLKSDPKLWWKYAYRAVSDLMKKESGKVFWEQVLKSTSLRKRYISLYATLLKADPSRLVVDDNKEIEALDREVDTEVILQWSLRKELWSHSCLQITPNAIRMLAHKLVEQSTESLKKQKTKKSWWSLGWLTGDAANDEDEPWHFKEEDWDQLNRIIGYKEADVGLETQDNGNVLHTFLEVHMKHNASKLVTRQQCLAELSCEDLDCVIKLYPEAKVFEVKLGSYKLSSPHGLLAESATVDDSLVGIFSYKPFGTKFDWSLVAKASPCYMTMTIDGVKRTAQQQVTKALKDHARFMLDLDVAAPKITIPTNFCPDNSHTTKLLLDLGNLVLHTQDEYDLKSPEENDMYLQFSLGLSDVSAFLVDGDYHWSQTPLNVSDSSSLSDHISFLPVIDKCGIVLKLQQIRTERPFYPSTRISARLPTLGFHFSPARYHRLMQVAKIFQNEDTENLDSLRPWDQADIEGWVSVLVWKGVGNREAAWKRRYICLVGPFLYILESPGSKTYKSFLSLRGKQIYQVPTEFAGNEGNVLALCEAGQSNSKVVEDVNAVILRFDSEDSRRTWQGRFQGAIYRASASAFSFISYKLYVWDVSVVAWISTEIDSTLFAQLFFKSSRERKELENRRVVDCDDESGENIDYLYNPEHEKLDLELSNEESNREKRNSASVTGMSETSSDSEDKESELVDGSNVMDLLTMEKMFITGVLDELKISFSYNCNVELSTRGNDMFIGAVLKSLEIEDLVYWEGTSRPRYLARSLIKNTNIPTIDSTPSPGDARNRSSSGTEVAQSDGEDKFFEASENLNDFVDCQVQLSGNISEYLSAERSFSSGKIPMNPPSFSRISGLLPDSEPQRGNENFKSDTLDSFVKAQIVIYDQMSPLYNNIDKQVTVTLATLSFFCHRPTIIAILEFVNAINIEDESCSTSTDNSSTSMVQLDEKSGSPDEECSSTIQEPIVKGLLGKGKSRVVFYLRLNMARAQVILMNENGTQLATLSQDNLLTDIKVFPSSFSIKATLGNLRVSDDSLPCSHSYFWVCDMRTSGGSSFVELEFTSYSVVDDDYKGYDYSLFGQLSEVRIIYLNRFIQEIVSYFMGLVPKDTKGVVKLKDQVTNSEKWFSTTEIDGSPALKLDLSLRKPIIVMPRRTDSHDFLELDVVHITVQNTFRWFCGDRNEMGAVHVEIITIQVEDINLTVGAGMGPGQSIIQDVKGLSFVIRRSLRDLLHQIPTTEAVIKIEVLKAALSNKEYQIITECALSNISETPNSVPPLCQNSADCSDDLELLEPSIPLPSDVERESLNEKAWTSMILSVALDLVELSLHSGDTRDASLATVQATGAWLLYKSNTVGEGFLSATLKGFSVIDDREGTQQEHRLAIGKSESLGYNALIPAHGDSDKNSVLSDSNVIKQDNVKLVPTMLILDAKLNKSSTSVFLCVQRPQLLVALDFLLAVVEFFVPTVRSMLSNEEDENPLHMAGAIILEYPIYNQPSKEFSLSPERPLIIDDERFGHYIYDGRDGILHLQDRENIDLCSPSTEAIIFVGNGKRLQFKNVHIKNGKYLDSSIYLGTNSSYSASEVDKVFLENGNEGIPQHPSEEGVNGIAAIGPELTFYNTSKDVRESLMLSDKLLHAELDVLCRLVLKGEDIEVCADALGLRMESNGVTIIEPFDTSIKFAIASGKTNIHFVVSDVFMNFSFSILRLFLAVEEDILAFLRMTSKKMTVVCSQFDKVGTIQDRHNDQTYTFWRPRAPPGFAILGDYLTPTSKPPTKGVLAVNTNFVRIKRPLSFKLIWPSLSSKATSDFEDTDDIIQDSAQPDDSKLERSCSVWFPEAPPGFIALGCVVSIGRTEPPSSAALCISASSVSRCALRDCITISLAERYMLTFGLSFSLSLVVSIKHNIRVLGMMIIECVEFWHGQWILHNLYCAACTLGYYDDQLTMYPPTLAFWRVDNSVGSFLPADPVNMDLIGRASELRQVKFGCFDGSSKASKSSDIQDFSLSQDGNDRNLHSERSSLVNSTRHFEAIASFRLVWWNQGSSSRKKLSIWHPIVTTGKVYLGDIAVQGYEPPNVSIVLHDTGDEVLYKAPIGFKPVGQIKKQRGMDSISFWLPQSPPGFVSLGCVACKGAPNQEEELRSLRCIRSDMVTADQFSEESIWDTSDVKSIIKPFSIWTTGNEVGTFVVRTGYKRPPKRFALRLADPNVYGADNTVIDAEVGTISAALFDDYGGLMVPLFNISLSMIGFSLNGRPDYLSSTVSFSLAARSYNDKYDSWEPLVEPVDSFLRYQYDVNAPGATSQIRVACMGDLNLNVSVSNANMIFQAYGSWNNLSHIQESSIKKEAVLATLDGRSIIDINHRRNYYIIPQNKLGHDLFIRATEMRGLVNIVRMPSSDMKPLKVPVPENMLNSHLKGKIGRKLRTMVTVIIADGQFPCVEGLSTHQYMVAIRLFPNQSTPSTSTLKQQSARTCGICSNPSLSAGLELVNWSETFFFKVDNLDNYMVEMIVKDMGKGENVGFYSVPLKNIGINISDRSTPYDLIHDLGWIELASGTPASMPQGDVYENFNGKIRCAILFSATSEVEDDKQSLNNGRKPGLLQISPTREGPWTSVRLNYAAPAACWRLGDAVVASELIVEDGKRYVNIRSLVSVSNHTEFVLDLCLSSKDSSETQQSVDNCSKQEEEENSERFETDEFFETERYDPEIGWVGCSTRPNKIDPEGGSSYEDILRADLPSGWQWVDDWHVDNASVSTEDGWVYAPDPGHLKWPETYNHLKFVNYARERRMIRRRKRMTGSLRQKISVGLLKPGDTVPLPLSCLRTPHILQFRPWNASNRNEYAWSSVAERDNQLDISSKPEEVSEICVTSLSEAEVLLHCSCNEIRGNSSSNGNTQGTWFCLTIQATDIGKDIHSDPIQDWNLVVKSPLSLINFLPLSAEFSVLQKQASGQFVSCSQGVFHPGKTVKIFNADLRQELYFSLLPQGGWLPIHESVLLSDPSGRVTSKTISLRSTFSERIVQVVLEQNHDKEQQRVAKVVRIYAPYWFASERCPQLTFRLVEIAKMKKRTFPLSFPSKQSNEVILEEITDEELLQGYTISSALHFKCLGLSVSLSQLGKGNFGPVKDLSSLGDMDGSIDLYAYDDDGKCIHLFISSKPCPYSMPTKVICVRPFMTFTNRIGQDIFIKLSSEDEPKVLRVSDSRVSFVYRETGSPEKLQVRLGDTDWCIPFEIMKEDTFFVVLRKQNGARRFLKTEIRGYEEGSRFLVVFRLGSEDGPVRFENRTVNKRISIRQSGLGDDAWIQLEPLSTTNFSWEDPYGQKMIDTKVQSGSITVVHQFNLTRMEKSSSEESALEVKFHVVEIGDLIIARFTEDVPSQSGSLEGSLPVYCSTSCMPSKMQNDTAPSEFIIELGVVGISVINHRPRELSYIYLERVFVSYSTGYNGGTTSRFKLILGYLQVDNQIPLTLLPVLLAPEQTSDIHHPVFKMTITMSNENIDGTQVYPYVYIRVMLRFVTDKVWRLSIHEPIIWAVVDFYKNLRLDRIPKSDTAAQVDPEIRVDLIDVSEVRLKISLETEPSQRPHGVLGVWSPILSAVGNALKLQVHLRKVMHKNRFMRRSSVVPAIMNRIWRDLIHNPVHLICSVDVLGMTSSTLASLSKGFAELSTDGQFLQLRSKQVWSRRITGVGDGIIQGTEALAQGFAFGVSGVVTKPVESARQYGLLGLAQGLGRAFLGFIVQPMSGALDFFSLTVDGIGASCSRCLEVFNNKTPLERIRNPRAIRADGIVREYCEREAIGQMILYLAEASRHFGCTEIFKEPSKYAWSDYYEEFFIVPYQRIVLISSRRVMLLQCMSPDKMDKKPCKIMWDVPWENLMALELAKAGHPKPSHLILHLKTFKRSENFVRLIKCSVEEDEGGESQAVQICSVVYKLWKQYQVDMRCVVLKVPSSQRHVYFSWEDANGRDFRTQIKPMIKPREFSSLTSISGERRFVKHTINFQKIWSSELELKGRCTLCRKQVSEDAEICSIWRPICPEGGELPARTTIVFVLPVRDKFVPICSAIVRFVLYVSVGDIARIGTHPPHVAALFDNIEGKFALPVGYDLVWRNCPDDYATPVSIWYPRPPDGFVSLGCIVMAEYTEPHHSSVYCVCADLAEQTVFEEQKVWTAPESYPWACHIYQVQSEALQFVALRQAKEESDWKPMRVVDHYQPTQTLEGS